MYVWSNQPRQLSLPKQHNNDLIFDHARLEEVLFLLEIHRLRHPREGIFGFGVLRAEANLRTAPVGYVVHVLLAQRRVQPEEAAWHGVPATGGFKFSGLAATA